MPFNKSKHLLRELKSIHMVSERTRYHMEQMERTEKEARKQAEADEITNVILLTLAEKMKEAAKNELTKTVLTTFSGPLVENADLCSRIVASLADKYPDFSFYSETSPLCYPPCTDIVVEWDYDDIE